MNHILHKSPAALPICPPDRFFFPCCLATSWEGQWNLQKGMNGCLCTDIAKHLNWFTGVKVK